MLTRLRISTAFRLLSTPPPSPLPQEDAAFNEFQQQKEKVSYFWIIEKKRLEDKKAELRNKDRELQDLEEKHQVIIKIYKQRVKHLLFEHQVRGRR